jgi:ATP-binding cassette subfamily B (MDR/TAP) protein 1
MIELLFRRTLPCPFEDGSIPFGYDSCDTYHNALADDMQSTSYKLGIYWAVVAVGCLVGNALVFWGFGMASERLNKRVRDSAFSALVRQEVAFFDKQSVGSITSQLQDDAARIHTFSGEPIRSLIMSLSSVLTGLIVSFVYMWPFALVSLGTIPFMGFATSVEMKTMFGEDEGGDGKEGLSSPGGIIVETLLNIRTVAALNMERQRYNDYVQALHKSEPRVVLNSVKSGATSGLSMLIQQWSNALQFWWGGWLLFNYPDVFSFEDFLVSMFALLFSLFALGAATMGASDKDEAKKAAGRIFYLLGRKSTIDPLGTEGAKLGRRPSRPSSRGNSSRRLLKNGGARKNPSSRQMQRGASDRM